MTRQVIKLGSSSIASQDGLALDVIAGLVSQIAAAQRDGHEIILVTSGAARLGRRLLAFEGPAAGAAPRCTHCRSDPLGPAAARPGPPRPDGTAADYRSLVSDLHDTLLRYQAPSVGPDGLGTALPAAVGQPALMALYRQLAAAVGVEVCQVLISRSDLASPGRWPTWASCCGRLRPRPAADRQRQ